MTVIWTRRAQRNLSELQQYIALDSPQNSIVIAKRIVEAVGLLATQPNMGRPGRVRETRELVISATPYIVAYRTGKNELTLIAIFHGSQKWPKVL